ncbi:hypothetical protein EJB05_01404, partial [Eragrostis curvula]
MARHRPDAAEAPLLAAGSKPDEAAPLPTPAKRNKYPLFCTVLASMTSVLMGYIARHGVPRRWQMWGVMSGAQIFMVEDLGLTDTQIEVLSGVINIYSLVGALLAGWTSDHLGRRLTIVLANIFFLAMAVAGGYAMLMAGRFIAGVGVGYTLLSGRCTSPRLRPHPPVGSSHHFPSYISNFVFSGLLVHLTWRVMFAAGAVPTVFLAAGVLTMPESPRWLAMKGRLAEAKAVLDKTSDTPAEAKQRLLDIEEGSGVYSVVQYGPRVLAMAGVTSNTLLLGLNVLVGVAKTCSILVAMVLADRVGRRPLFSVGYGPLVWVYGAEILPLRLRGQGAGLSTAMNRLMSGVVTMTFISLYQAITMAGAFYLYAAIAATAFVFIYTCVPETKGHSLEDMEDLFHTK